MGNVYARLIEDVSEDEGAAKALLKVYTSWMDLPLSDYNSDLFCQPRDYLAECYRQGEILD